MLAHIVQYHAFMKSFVMSLFERQVFLFCLGKHVIIYVFVFSLLGSCLSLNITNCDGIARNGA